MRRDVHSYVRIQDSTTTLQLENGRTTLAEFR